MDNLNSFFTIQGFAMSHNVSPYSGHRSLQMCSTEWNPVPLAESIANHIGRVKFALEGGWGHYFNEGSGKSRPVRGGGMKATPPSLFPLTLFYIPFDCFC